MILRWLAMFAVSLSFATSSAAETIHPDLVLKLQIVEEDVPVLEELLESFANGEGLRFFRRHAMGPLPDKRPTVRSYYLAASDDAWSANADNLFSDDFHIFFYERKKSARGTELTLRLCDRLEGKWPGKVVPIDPRDIRLNGAGRR